MVTVKHLRRPAEGMSIPGVSNSAGYIVWYLSMFTTAYGLFGPVRLVLASAVNFALQFFEPSPVTSLLSEGLLPGLALPGILALVVAYYAQSFITVHERKLLKLQFSFIAVLVAMADLVLN